MPLLPPTPPQVLPTQLVPDDKGQYLRVRLIQKEGSKMFDPVYLFDEGSTISWIPCGRKLTCSFPGALLGGMKPTWNVYNWCWYRPPCSRTLECSHLQHRPARAHRACNAACC